MDVPLGRKADGPAGPSQASQEVYILQILSLIPTRPHSLFFNIYLFLFSAAVGLSFGVWDLVP